MLPYIKPTKKTKNITKHMHYFNDHPNSVPKNSIAPYTLYINVHDTTIDAFLKKYYVKASLTTKIEAIVGGGIRISTPF
jgi:hypothetical protein